MDQRRTAFRPQISNRPAHDIILDRLRSALRERPRTDFQRQDLAKHARVSPALISYYFSDRSTLFAAAVQPVMDRSIADLKPILSSDAPLSVRLKGLTQFLVRFYFREGYLIDFCLEHTTPSGGLKQADRSNGVDAEILEFFRELPLPRQLGVAQARILQSKLCAMCKHVAHGMRSEALPVAGDSVFDQNAEMIFNWFIDGASGPHLNRDMSPAA